MSKKEHNNLSQVYINTLFNYTWRIGFFVVAWLTWSFGMHFWQELPFNGYVFYFCTIIGASTAISALYILFKFLFQLKKIANVREIDSGAGFYH